MKQPKVRAMTPAKIRAEVEKKGKSAYVKIPDEDYFAMTDFMSHSTLKLIKDSPSKMQWAIKHPMKSSPAMALGSAIHAAILEPDLFEKEYKVKPKCDMRTKAGKQQSEEWNEENPGVKSVNQFDMDVIVKVRGRVMDDPQLSQFVTGGSKECSFFAKNTSVENILMKGKLDQIVTTKNGTFIVDIKTTDSANRHVFNNDITKYSYLTQASYYMKLVEEATGERPDGYVILALEKTKDCDVQTFYFDNEDLELGSKLCEQWLQRYALCLSTNEWPGYERQFIRYKAPEWFRRSVLGQEEW